MLALYKLQAKAYFSNIFARIDFLTTVLFLVVIGSVTGGQFDSVGLKSAANTQIISNITILMIMNSALYAFGLSFYEMKKSVLLKRIGATKISKPVAISAFLLWGFTTTMFIIVWIAIWVGMFQIPGIANHTDHLLYILPATWKSMNWGGIVVAIIISTISFYAIAFLFVSISKNSEIYNISTTFYFFIVAFLGGAFAPTANREWMTVIGYCSPLGWTSKFMSDAMAGISVFHFGGYISITANGPEHVNAFFATGRVLFPIVFGGLAAATSAKAFSWD